jgi:hypothetical protein
MGNILKYIGKVTWGTFLISMIVLNIIYLIVINYYPYIIGAVILYVLFKKRVMVMNGITKFVGWIKKQKFIIPKSEIEKIQDMISEIKSKGKLSDRDKNNIDLLNIKIKQLQNV